MSKKECFREVAGMSQINRCIKALNHVEGSVIKLVDMLKLAGNDVRLKILYLLSREHPRCPQRRCFVSNHQSTGWKIMLIHESSIESG